MRKDFELWIINENAQYRIQNQKMRHHIELSFWIPDSPIKLFRTTYENLIKIIESTDKSLCFIEPE